MSARFRKDVCRRVWKLPVGLMHNVFKVSVGFLKALCRGVCRLRVVTLVYKRIICSRCLSNVCKVPKTMSVGLMQDFCRMSIECLEQPRTIMTACCRNTEYGCRLRVGYLQDFGKRYVGLLKDACRMDVGRRSAVCWIAVSILNNLCGIAVG